MTKKSPCRYWLLQVHDLWMVIPAGPRSQIPDSRVDVPPFVGVVRCDAKGRLRLPARPTTPGARDDEVGQPAAWWIMGFHDDVVALTWNRDLAMRTRPLTVDARNRLTLGWGLAGMLGAPGKVFIAVDATHSVVLLKDASAMAPALYREVTSSTWWPSHE